MKLVSFSNKRPASAEQGSFLTVAPTEGKIRITNIVAKAMGLVEGDYAAVASDAESGKIYLYKGIKDEKAQVGNKVALAGATFEFTSKNVWDELKGSTDKSIRFDVAEEAVPFEDMLLFEISNPVEKAKTERRKREEKEDTGVEAPVETEAPVEISTDDEAGFTLD